MQTTLITGANRGIGLEHARQALAAGEHVIACSREPDLATELKALSRTNGDRLTVYSLEVTSDHSVDQLQAALAGVPIDILINNAGYMGQRSWQADDASQQFGSIDFDQWRQAMEVNLYAPMRMVAALQPNLALGHRKLVVMMSSDLASIASNTMGGTHGYRTSKTALNMLTRGLAIDLGKEGISVVALSPGWTKTDMGGENAIWEVVESVRRQREVIAGMGREHSGRFFNLQGEELPW